jgi:hypothetical protein
MGKEDKANRFIVYDLVKGNFTFINTHDAGKLVHEFHLESKI